MDNSILTLNDFPQLKKGFIENDFNVNTMREVIKDNFSKGQINEELFIESNDILDSIEKGKRAEIGEIRQFGDKKYQRNADGWLVVIDSETQD